MSEKLLSQRIKNMNISGTVKFTPLIQRLEKQGKDLISLAIGEPDIPPPKPIVKATLHALKGLKTRYGAVSGLKKLKTALCKKFQEENNIDYVESNILISNGAKQCLFNVLQVLCDPTDEVLIIRPCWPTYEEQVKSTGAKPVFIETKDHQLPLEGIREKISDATKAIIINSPNNPSGAVYPRKDLKQIANLAIKHNFFIISDEAYEKFVYDNRTHCSIASLGKKVKERTITITSFSKTFSMTGFRIGYLGAPQPVTSAIKKLQSHLTGNVCTFAQYGALKALDIETSVLQQRTELFEERRDFAFTRANELFECKKPQGAFYLFPHVGKVLNDNVQTVDRFVEMLLKNAHVVVIPGAVFGVPDHVRISFAGCTLERLREGFNRMAKLIGDLH